MANVDGPSDSVFEIVSLISAYPPPFIFVHAPHTSRLLSSSLQDALSNLQNTCAIQPLNMKLKCAFVDAITCFTPRLLYDTVLNALAGWVPEWNEGCSNWTGPHGVHGQRLNESFDAFTHGLRALRASLASAGQDNVVNGKGKSKAADTLQADASITETRLVIVIERAERLKESMPELLVPLTRVAELSQTEVTMILVSDISWEYLRPPLGAALDPYYVNVGPMSKQAIVNRLASTYDSLSNQRMLDNPDLDPNTYHPALEPLYVHFLSTLCSICSPFTTDPDELAYIAAARWPGFVQPILDEHRQRERDLQSGKNRARDDGDEQDEFVPDSEDEDGEVLELQPPTEDTRIRLTRLFTPSLTSALEALYPRLTFAGAWARTNAPPSDLLCIPPRQVPTMPARMPDDRSSERALKELPRMAKFILVAAYIASTNPPKSDMRMFGRGPDERAKRRRRKGGGTRKVAAKNAAVKIPQRLLGPTAFPMDRLTAILGILLEENDADARPPVPEYTVPGEYTEMEISRVAISAQVMQLTSSNLLHQTSPSDRLDMSPAFKCGIGYDAALTLAREIGVNLRDLLWDPA